MAKFLTLLSCALSMTMLAHAERLDFSSIIPASGTQCYLENIGETIQGKSQSASRLANHALFHFVYSRGESERPEQKFDLDDH